MRLLSLLLAASLVPTSIIAQVVAPVAVGSRVRYWERAGGDTPTVAIVDGISDDTLLLRRGGSALDAHVPRSSIIRMDVSAGRMRSHATGALGGLGLGVLAGAMGGGIASATTRRKSGLCDCVPTGLNIAVGAVLGGVLGLVAGTIIGIPREHWQGVSLPSR